VNYLPQNWTSYIYAGFRKHPFIVSISNFTHLQAVLFEKTFLIPTCSEQLLTGMVRRPDNGQVRTEICSEHLLSGLLRSPDDGRVRKKNI
jgi:hypothetical protein